MLWQRIEELQTDDHYGSYGAALASNASAVFVSEPAFDMRRGRVHVLPADGGPPTTIEGPRPFSEYGKRIAASDTCVAVLANGLLQVVELSSGRELWAEQGSDAWDVALTSRWCAVSTPRSVHVFRATDGAKVLTLPYIYAQVRLTNNFLYVVDDGSLLVYSNVAMRWRPSPTYRLQLEAATVSAFAAHDDLVAVAGDGAIRIYRNDSDERWSLRQRIRYPLGAGACIALAIEGGVLAASFGGAVVVFRAAGATFLQEAAIGDWRAPVRTLLLPSEDRLLGGCPDAEEGTGRVHGLQGRPPLTFDDRLAASLALYTP